jgi:hypothetical protein
VGQVLHGGADGIHEGAEHARTHLLELPPQGGLVATPCVRDLGEGQAGAAVEQVGAGRYVLDAVKHHRAGGVEQLLLVVRVKLPGPEAAARRQGAERVREVGRQPREVVEGDHPAIRGAIIKSLGSYGGRRGGAWFGSMRARPTLQRVDFALPCSPFTLRIGEGRPGRRDARSHAINRVQASSSSRLTRGRSSSRLPPRTGSGRGSMPRRRINFTGQSLTTSHPDRLIRTTRQAASTRSR